MYCLNEKDTLGNIIKKAKQKKQKDIYLVLC